MYGIPARRFEDDYYKDHKFTKNVDFAIGFLVSLLFWYFFFNPVWYVAPLILFAVAMIGIFLKFKRRYFIYGVLAVVFFPLVIWGGTMVGWAGRKEVNS